MIQFVNEEIIHMLGYLTEDKWIDALQIDELDKEELWELIEYIEDRYKFEMHDVREQFNRPKVIKNASR